MAVCRKQGAWWIDWYEGGRRRRKRTRTRHEGAGLAEPPELAAPRAGRQGQGDRRPSLCQGGLGYCCAVLLLVCRIHEEDGEGRRSRNRRIHDWFGKGPDQTGRLCWRSQRPDECVPYLGEDTARERSAVRGGTGQPWTRTPGHAGNGESHLRAGEPFEVPPRRAEDARLSRRAPTSTASIGSRRSSSWSFRSS